MTASKLEQWRSLDAVDQARLLGLSLALPLTSVLVAIAGVQRSRRWLEWISERTRHAPSHVEIAQADALARLASVAGRHGPINATCLRQALVVQFLLRRRGLPAELVLGVRLDGEQGLDAHAWVELASRPLGQDQLRHAPLRKLEDVAH